MSEPTPVTTSTITMESWSTSRSTPTEKPPTTIHSNSLTVAARPSSPADTRRAKVTTASTNATDIVVLAIGPAARPMRLPNSSRTIAPASGSAMIAGANAATPSVSACARITRLPPQQAHAVDVRRPSVASDQKDDGKAHDDLCRRNHEHEEDEDLAVDIAVNARKGDEHEVDRVQHQLDKHEDHDRVAAQESADRSDGEHQSREGEIEARRDAHAASSSMRSVDVSTALIEPIRRARTMTPTIATTRRTEVSSKGNR